MAAVSDSSNAGGSSVGPFRELLRSASWTAVLQFTSAGAGFATALLLARLLGREDYGIYAFCFAWAGLLALVATLGADRFLVRGVGVYTVRNELGLMKGLLRRINQLVCFASIAIAVGGCVVAVGWLSPALRAPFCVSMLLVPLTALTLVRQGAMQGFGRVVSGQLPEYLIRPLLIIVGIVLAEWLGVLSPTSALWITVAGVGTAFLVGAILLLRALPRTLRAAAREYATREWMRASVSMMVIAGTALLNNYIGTLVAGTLRGPGTAGVYSVVQSSASLVALFLVAANMPLAPVVARLHALGDQQQLERTTQRVAQACMLVSAPLCAVFVLVPGLFLGFFGAEFEVGGTALAIVALGQFVNATAGPAGNVLMMTGHELGAARGIGAAALANLVLAVLLVPPLGVTGSAIAFATSLVLSNAALVIIARRRLGINVTAFSRLALVQSAPD